MLTAFHTARRRSVALTASAMLAMTVLVGGIALNNGSSANAAGDPSDARKAEALSRAPSLMVTGVDGSVTLRADPVEYSVSEIEEAAKKYSAEVPFPPGLNSASHIDWAKAVDGGIGGTSMSASALQRVIQANAERDWAWYAANHDLTAEQTTIVQSISQWSGRRPARPGTTRLSDKVLQLGRSEEAKLLTSRTYPDGRPKPSRWR